MPNQIIPLIKKMAVAGFVAGFAGLLIVSIGHPTVVLAQQAPLRVTPNTTGCGPVAGQPFYGLCPVAPLAADFHNAEVLPRSRRLFIVPRNQLPQNAAQWNNLVHGRVNAVEFRYFPQRGSVSESGSGATRATGNNPGLYFQAVRHQNGRSRALGGNGFPLADGSYVFGLDFSTYNATRLELFRSYEQLYEDYVRECEARGNRDYMCRLEQAGRQTVMWGLPAVPPALIFWLLHAAGSRNQNRLVETPYFQRFLERWFAVELNEHLVPNQPIPDAVSNRIRALSHTERLNLLRSYAFQDAAFLTAMNEATVQEWGERVTRWRGSHVVNRTRSSIYQWVLGLERVNAAGEVVEHAAAEAAHSWRMRPLWTRLTNSWLIRNRVISGLSSGLMLSFRKAASNNGFLALFGAGILYGGFHSLARYGVTGELPFASQIAAFTNSTPETEAELDGGIRGRFFGFRGAYVDRFYLHHFMSIAHQSLGVNGRIVSCLGAPVNPIGLADREQILDGAAQAVVAGEQLADAQQTPQTPAQAEEQVISQAFEQGPSSGGNCVVNHRLSVSNENYRCSNEHNACVMAQSDSSSIADLSERLSRYFREYVRAASSIRLDGTFLNATPGHGGGR